jgi:HSP20 family molecular chaperone IbpA
MMDFILDVQETRFTIHDESLKFSAMIKPEIISLKYEKGVLSINYKWKEV